VSELQLFADNVWIADGPSVRDFGVLFTTRMTVVRLSDGSLWVSSPVAASAATLDHVTWLGPVKYLVAGTPRHVWRLELWHKLFPEAELWAMRRTPFTLAKVHLPLTGILSDAAPQTWADDLDQLTFKGNHLMEEAFFFHRRSRTLILDDLIQVHAPVKGRPVTNALIKLAGVAAPHGGVGLDMRLSFTNRKAARQSLARLLSWDIDKLILAHGPCLEADAKPFVERAFQWLSDDPDKLRRRPGRV
jgi:hypothetical protein